MDINKGITIVDQCYGAIQQISGDTTCGWLSTILAERKGYCQTGTNVGIFCGNETANALAKRATQQNTGIKKVILKRHVTSCQSTSEKRIIKRW